MFDSAFQAACACVAAVAVPRLVSFHTPPFPSSCPAAHAQKARGRDLGAAMRQGGRQSAPLDLGAAFRSRRRVARPCAPVLLPSRSPTRLRVCLGPEPLPAVGSLLGVAPRATRRPACVHPATLPPPRLPARLDFCPGLEPELPGRFCMTWAPQTHGGSPLCPRAVAWDSNRCAAPYHRCQGFWLWQRKRSH